MHILHNCNRLYRRCVPIREKASRKVLRLSSRRRFGIFNRHFHSAHDPRSVTAFHKLFGALKNSPSVVVLVHGFLCADMVSCFMGFGHRAALFHLASRTLIRIHERSCRSIDRVTSFRERILLLLGVAVDHNDLAIFLFPTSNIDFYGCELAYLFPYVTRSIKFHR